MEIVFESSSSRPLSTAPSVERLDSSSIQARMVKRERSNSLRRFNTTISRLRHNQMVYISPHLTGPSTDFPLLMGSLSDLWSSAYLVSVPLWLGHKSNRFRSVRRIFFPNSLLKWYKTPGWCRTCPPACCRSSSKRVCRSNDVRGVWQSVLFFCL